MKKAIVTISVILAAGLASAALSVEEAKENFIAARKAYFELIGRTNAVSRAHHHKRAQSTAAKSKVVTKEQADFLNGRRIAVSRDTETIPGSVITTWYRNGKPDTKMQAVVTNVLSNVVGTEQNNPLQNMIVNLTNSFENIRSQLLVASNRYEIAEARISNAKHGLNKKRDEYVEKRDKAALPTTKAIYQAFIDIIDDIIERLDALMSAGKE